MGRGSWAIGTVPAVPNGTNVDEQDVNDIQTDGFKPRVNLTWRITGDALVYATWSEGYRPGGFNRGSSCNVLDPSHSYPAVLPPHLCTRKMT